MKVEWCAGQTHKPFSVQSVVPCVLPNNETAVGLIRSQLQEQQIRLARIQPFSSGFKQQKRDHSCEKTAARALCLAQYERSEDWENNEICWAERKVLKHRAMLITASASFNSKPWVTAPLKTNNTNISPNSSTLLTYYYYMCLKLDIRGVKRLNEILALMLVLLLVTWSNSLSFIDRLLVSCSWHVSRFTSLSNGPFIVSCYRNMIYFIAICISEIWVCQFIYV